MNRTESHFPGFLTRMLEGWRRRVPLLVKILVLVGLAGILTWEGKDRFMTARSGEIFHRHMLKILEDQASEDRLLLHDFLNFHSWAVVLLARQEEFIRYVTERVQTAWRDPPPPMAFRHEKRPSWLPGNTITRKMAYAAYVLLLDGEYRLREIYGQEAVIPEDALFTDMLTSTARVDGRHNIVQRQGRLYLITSAAYRDGAGTPMGHLVFISPMDDEFLFMFQQQYRSSGIVAFIDGETQHIVASSRPDQVKPDTPVKALEADYHVSGKNYFDYGFTSEVMLRFATLIPLASLAELNNALQEEERTQRALAHGGLMVVFLLMVYGISRRISGFVKEMDDFARLDLGMEPRQFEGDQLQGMKEQFRIMAQEIVRAKERDAEYNEELEVTNDALRESLELLKRTHAQMVQSEKLAALGSLVAGLAHEINTPIGIAFTSATHLGDETRNLEKRYQGEEMRRSDLEHYLQVALESSGLIEGNLNRATRLIRSFKQVTVDQASGERRVFNLGAYLEEVVQSLGPRLRKSRVTIRIEAPNNITIENYPGAISQIITNLVINTLTHAYAPEEEGIIVLNASLVEGKIILNYKDEGRGIPQENLSHIFEPFFTTIRGKGGSGLGLHIVHTLVTQTLNGKIHCNSVVGVGTEFNMEFPAEGQPHAR